MTKPNWLSEVRGRLTKATPGPWKFKGGGGFSEWESKQLENDDGEFVAGEKSIIKSWDYEGYSSGIYIRPDDAIFMSNSRTDLEKAVELIESYERTLERIVREGIDTSTDGGMRFVSEALEAGKQIKERP